MGHCRAQCVGYFYYSYWKVNEMKNIELFSKKKKLCEAIDKVFAELPDAELDGWHETIIRAINSQPENENEETPAIDYEELNRTAETLDGYMWEIVSVCHELPDELDLYDEISNIEYSGTELLEKLGAVIEKGKENENV